ncbi:ABC transporter permease [Microbacterium sp. AG1240]|uniref:ABC transporter permease n=1 Tax=Microbacterium sp. AG1240 TaxID=2183992 RepID=UPI000EB19277|nr:ABC transporter permease [Microbacterium sp. AG1240]
MSNTQHLNTDDSPVTRDVSTVPPRTEALATRRGRRPGKRFLPRMSAKLATGLFLVISITLFSFLGPFFTQDPRNSGNAAMQPPSWEHPLGTTKLGYDVLAQLANGGQGSLLVGLVAGGLAIVLSMFFGILAGYLGGWRDEALSLVTNIMLVIPGLPLVMVIATYFQSRTWLLVALVLGVTSWAGSAVVLRAQARSVRARDYVNAAKVSGEKPGRVILVEMMPNMLPLLTGQFLFAVVFAILGEAGLSYLGLGATDSITWGTMLNDARSGQALGTGAWWWFVPPGIMIALFGCGLALINFSIDEIINPKLRTAPAAARRVRKVAKEQGVTA